MAEITEQIVREAPQIEAYKLGLLESAKKLSEQPLTMPAYQVAGLTEAQKQAGSLATQGIGAYQPFLQAGQRALETGIGIFGQQQGRAMQAAQQYGQFGVQQAALGQGAQQMGQQDISALLGIGQQQQQTEQAILDAQRATTLQAALTPYQQTSFLSDIYKGAPGTQVALTAQTAPQTSPLLQAAGLGIAGLSAATGAKKAGLFG